MTTSAPLLLAIALLSATMSWVAAPAAFAQEAEPPAPAASAEVPAHTPDTAEQQQTLFEEFSKAYQDFEGEAKEYREDVQLFLERRFREKQEGINRAYESHIRRMEVDERREREEAIALLERFIERYRDDPKYTPDAMTRLAELYYEKTVDDQYLAQDAYDRRVKLGAVDDDPPEQTRSFEKPIALYQEILTRFPEYRLIDSIYYLLGWCLSEQGETDEARETFLALIGRFPASKHVPEAWVRVGEYYFDKDVSELDERARTAAIEENLRRAVDAYTHVLQFKDSPFYDKALYKLGWSHYRRNDLQSGVTAFTGLLDYYESLRAQGKPGGEDLRAEAVQYTAASFADPSWGSVRKMTEFFRSRGGRPYEGELFRRLGDVLYDADNNPQAVEAYRIVLQRDPLAPDAPVVQDRIAQAFLRDQKRREAFEERARMQGLYGEKSAWAQANAHDPEVLRVAAELMEKNLYSTAAYHHQQAIAYEESANAEDTPPGRVDELRRLAFEEYKAAAVSYGGYLVEFPHSKRYYETTYLHAETLFNSRQYVKAAEQYAKVRDSNTDEKYLAQASFNVVAALQMQIESEERAGRLPRRAPCTPESCRGMAAFEPQELPRLRQELIAAADVFMKKVPDADEDAARLSYAAGQTYFTYFHFDEARARYEELIRRYPSSTFAFSAYEDILVTWLLEKNYEQIEIFADRMIRESKAVQSDPDQVSAKRLLKYGARFERAGRAMTEQKWDDASRLYISIVDETEAEADRWGKWENADKALYNAAACFKEARRFDSAMRTYERLYENYPNSELAQNALFYVAESADRAFEFEKAIERYRLLVERYHESKDRVGAAFNMAHLLEALQRYPEAARAYQDYARLFPDESDAPDQAFKAALIYERMRDWNGMIKGLKEFVATYERAPAQRQKVVKAYLKIAQAYRKLGKEKDALAFYELSKNTFDRLQMTPQDDVAAEAAAEAHFELTEIDFAKFQNLKFDPKGRTQERLAKSINEQLELLATSLDRVKTAYTEIIVKYRWPDWQMASLFRLGNTDESFAQKLLDAPCPAQIMAEFGEEGCDSLRVQIEERVGAILDRANEAYLRGQDQASEQRITNRWTKLNDEKICRNVPMRCRSLKDARGPFIREALSARPLAADATGLASVVFDPSTAPVRPEPAPEAAPETPAAPAGIGSPADIAPAAPQPSPARDASARPQTEDDDASVPAGAEMTGAPAAEGAS